MPEFSLVVLYVADPAKSAEFYARILGKPIVEQSPTFAVLPLREGVMLGLWVVGGVKPAAGGKPGASELTLTVADDAAVEETHSNWAKGGVVIAQPPTKLDFGFAFTALDPDGHRVRVARLDP